MYLLHVATIKSMNKALKDGYMKPSSVTKNVQMYGQKQGSDYIYFKLPYGNDAYSSSFYFDDKLLLENVFYLQTGWNGGPVVDKIDGRKLSYDKLKKILKKFKRRIKYFVKKRESEGKYANLTNEILVEKNVSLEKYLVKMQTYGDKKMKKYVEANYPNVEIIN